MTGPAAPVVAVAVSGGRDSTALLHATLRSAAALGLRVVALHIHHGLQAEADAWARQVQAQCLRWQRAGWPVRCRVHRLTAQPSAGESVEAWARRERYAALRRLAAEEGAELVLLAHHRQDQAETVLLQALRGAGPRGLAAMPTKVRRDGLVWARPWLEHPGSAIAHYVQRHRLSHVHDASNHDPRYARSRLRQQVWPALSAAFDHAEASLAASARHAARAADLQREVAAADLLTMLDAHGDLEVAAWCALSPARQWLALQAWLQEEPPLAVSDATVDRLALALPAARQGRWPIGQGGEVRLYRGRLSKAPASTTGLGRLEPPAPCPAPVAVARPELGLQLLPDWRGCVLWERVAQGGLSLTELVGAQWQARGGRAWQFQATERSLPRSLKKQFQAAAVPAWARQAPLLCRGDRLLWVPGLGVDARVRCARAEPQWLPRWVAEQTSALRG